VCLAEENELLHFNTQILTLRDIHIFPIKKKQRYSYLFSYMFQMKQLLVKETNEKPEKVEQRIIK